MRFVLPIPPQQANARGRTWRVQHGKKKTYWKLLDSLQFLNRDGFVIPPPPKKLWPKATISAHWFVHSVMDADNSISRSKYVLDWLVTRGYLEDDSPKHLRWLGIPEQEIDRKFKRVEIELLPVSE